MKKIGIIIFIILFLTTGCFGPKCPEDYTLDEENNVCFKILEMDAIKNEEHYCLSGELINNMCYSCGSGYLINGMCYPSPSTYPESARTRYHGITREEYFKYGFSAAYDYYCSYGYELVGNMCYPIESYPNITTPLSNVSYDCPFDYTKNRSGIKSLVELDLPYIGVPKCYKRITAEPNNFFD